MASNSLYPGFVRLTYSANGHSHKMTLPVKPELVGSDWLLRQKNGNLVSGMATLVPDLWAVVKPYFVAADALSLGELWTLSSPGADPVFQEIESFNIVGTNGGATQDWSEQVCTYRTDAGGLYRMYMMEQARAVDQKVLAPFGAGIDKNLADYLTGGTSFVYGRDGGALTAPISHITKTNDALRKKYFLDA